MILGSQDIVHVPGLLFPSSGKSKGSSWDSRVQASLARCGWMVASVSQPHLLWYSSAINLHCEHITTTLLTPRVFLEVLSRPELTLPEGAGSVYVRFQRR